MRKIHKMEVSSVISESKYEQWAKQFKATLTAGQLESAKRAGVLMRKKDMSARHRK